MSIAAPRRALCSAAFVLAAGLSLMACGGAAPPAGPDENARSVASADVRLRGAWTLASFVPETALEPMLKSMLEFQYRSMSIHFDGERMTADSPGVHVDRRYRIAEAYGDRFKVVAFDEQGVPYESWCTFVADGAIEVHSETPPWRGVATLHRVAP